MASISVAAANYFPDSSLYQSEVKFHQFSPVTETEMKRLSRKIACISCHLDPVPSSILKIIPDDVLPLITKISKLSISEAIMPSRLKSASLSSLLLLKKATLDSDDYTSYRPISNLTFVSKCIEKVVASQICNPVQENNLIEVFQSAYKRHHNTETALIKVQDDILPFIDNKCAVILLLLELSAAFDTVDHGVLLDRMSKTFGIVDTALDWFASYLSDRKQTVYINGCQSSQRSLRCGVPQGSLLGPYILVHLVI